MLCNCPDTVEVPLCTNTLNIGRYPHNCTEISSFVRNGDFTLLDLSIFGGKFWTTSGTGSWTQTPLLGARAQTSAGQTTTLEQIFLEFLKPDLKFQLSFGIGTFVSGEVEVKLVDIDGNELSLGVFNTANTFTIDVDLSTFNKDVNRIRFIAPENTDLHIVNVVIVDADMCNDVTINVKNTFNGHVVPIEVKTVGVLHDILLDLASFEVTFFQTEFIYEITITGVSGNNVFINYFQEIDLLKIEFIELLNPDVSNINTNYFRVKTKNVFEETAIIPFISWAFDSLEVESTETDNVLRLISKVGNGLNMIREAPAFQPVLLRDVNNKPRAIEFDGSQSMQSRGDFPYNRDFIKSFMLIKPLPPTASYRVIFEHRGADGFFTLYANSDTLGYGFEIQDDVANEFTFRETTVKDMLENYVMVEMEFNAGEVKMHINGIEALLINEASGGAFNVVPFIAQIPDLDGDFFLADGGLIAEIKEIKIFDSKLPEAQLVAERRELFAKIKP